MLESLPSPVTLNKFPVKLSPRVAPVGFLDNRLALKRDKAFGKLRQAEDTVNSNINSLTGNLPTNVTDTSSEQYGMPVQTNLGLLKTKKGIPDSKFARTTNDTYSELIVTPEMTASNLAIKGLAKSIRKSDPRMPRYKYRAVKQHTRDGRKALNRYHKFVKKYEKASRKLTKKHQGVYGTVPDGWSPL